VRSLASVLTAPFGPRPARAPPLSGGLATWWFVYLNAPLSRLAIAERARAGNRASVPRYVRELEQAFAIPILR
jgi:hypothetical protein